MSRSECQNCKHPLRFEPAVGAYCSLGCKLTAQKVEDRTRHAQWSELSNTDFNEYYLFVGGIRNHLKRLGISVADLAKLVGCGGWALAEMLDGPARFALSQGECRSLAWARQIYSRAKELDWERRQPEPSCRLYFDAGFLRRLSELSSSPAIVRRNHRMYERVMRQAQEAFMGDESPPVRPTTNQSHLPSIT